MADCRSRFVVLAVDIGSSSTRTALFDERARRIPKSAASQEYQVSYTVDGGAELDPRTLLRAAKSCLRTTLRARGNARVAAVGGSGFWHSLLGLDHDRRPITPIWTWADSRSASDALKLRRRWNERDVQSRTGCMLRSVYWPAKLRWLARTEPALFHRVRHWTSPAEWIFGQLFGVSDVSASMASGTGLFRPDDGQWDSGLMRDCKVPRAWVSALENASAIYTAVGSEFDGAQIFPAIGDGAAGNLGSGADRPRVAAVNFGTSAAVRVIGSGVTKRTIPVGLFRHCLDETRSVLGGAVSNAGNLRHWCLRELRVTEAESLSREKAASDSLTVLPFWVKERAPTWPDDLAGAITGLTQATTAAELLRATTCSVFYRLRDILDLIETSTGRVDEIIISGGIATAPDAVKILADCFGRDVRISREPEASLRGAAVYALHRFGCNPPRLRPGKLIHHRPALTAQHRLRHERQRQLESDLA